MLAEGELLDRLSKLTWDTTLTNIDLLKILRKEGEFNSTTQKQLYIKMLNWFSWHQIREMVPNHQLPELLSDEVIQGVFPVDLREKYRYVKSLL